MPKDRGFTAVMIKLGTQYLNSLQLNAGLPYEEGHLFCSRKRNCNGVRNVV